MKILKFTAENVKRLHVVEITPDGNVVQITGKNGSGKSSVLDAIRFALGGERAIDAEPLRKGAAGGSVTLDLGDLIVRRRFSAGGGTSLVVEDKASGAEHRGPQGILDKLYSQHTFDAVEFQRADAKAQLQMLRGLVTLDVDVDALDAANREDFAERAALNKRIVAEKAVVGSMEDVSDFPAEELPLGDVISAMEAVAQRNQTIAREEIRREQLKANRNNTRRLVDEKRRAAEQLIGEADAMAREALAQDVALEALPPLESPQDATEIRQQIADAQAHNAKVNARRVVEQHQRDLAALEAQSETLTRAMRERTTQKTTAIEAAAMPIAGLGFGDGVVTFNGLPFAQASSAEQLRISVAIAMAANPTLRVMRIKDGSLLDEANLATIATMAKDGDYQIWIERVDASGKIGIVMEDGAVAAVQS